MSNLLSQKHRLLSFDSPLGEKLLVTEFSGTEAISQMFHFNLKLASEDFGIHWNQIVGKNVTVGIRHLDGVTFRYWNGIVSKFAPIRHPGRLAYYKAEMVPWLWFLTNTKDCLYFQDETVPDIIAETFDKYGLNDWEFNLTDQNDRHTPWEYCCQYRESAFHFVSRLMEIEGIYYYFRHEKGKHTLVMLDDKTGHVDLPFQAQFRLDHQIGEGLLRTEETIFNVDMFKHVKPASYHHKEFNFEQPDNPLLFWSNVDDSEDAVQEYEVYDYPGEFEDPTDGRDWSTVRQEEQEHDRILSRGEGNGRAMTPGYRISLTEHDRHEQNIDYLITSVEHTATEGTLLPGTDTGVASYKNSFVLIPFEVQYRARRDTKHHQMLGSQTAIVVGPKGEEIHTDKYGRVKVQFHWDRHGKFDENSSCWIRVMQPIAGPQFGHIWLPRIGQEVIVDFLEGDPDRPIITGCVYNEKNMPPYPLPDKKNWSGIKTRSTIGGTAKNYNELRFVDTKGEELYVMHAERDMEITVNHDTSEEVDHDRTLLVKHDQTETIEHDKHITVKGEQREEIQKDFHHAVKGERREEVKKNLSLQVDGKIDEKAGGNFTLESAGDVHIKAAGRIILEAAQGILFIGKGGFIDVTDQVIIQGSQVYINCGKGMPDGANDADPQAPLSPGSNLADLPFGGELGGMDEDFPEAPLGGAIGGAMGVDPSSFSDEFGMGSPAADALGSGSLGAASGFAAGANMPFGDAGSGLPGMAGGDPFGAARGLTSGISAPMASVSGAVSSLGGQLPNLASLASNPFVAGILSTGGESSVSQFEKASEQSDSDLSGLPSSDTPDDPQGTA